MPENENQVVQEAQLSRTYIPQNWINGISKLSASRMNHIEHGIDALDQRLLDFIGKFEITGIEGSIDFNDYVLKNTQIAGIQIGNGISAENLARALGFATSGDAAIIDLSEIDFESKDAMKAYLFNDLSTWNEETVVYNTDPTEYAAGNYIDSDIIQYYAEEKPFKITLKMPSNLFVLPTKVGYTYEIIDIKMNTNLDVDFVYDDVNQEFIIYSPDYNLLTYSEDENGTYTETEFSDGSGFDPVSENGTHKPSGSKIDNIIFYIAKVQTV